MIQKSLDVHKEQPLVGLKYLDELNIGANKEMGYHCIMCDKRSYPQTNFGHFTSQLLRQLVVSVRPDFGSN
jgi:hypothetical protein